VGSSTLEILAGICSLFAVDTHPILGGGPKGGFLTGDDLQFEQAEHTGDMPLTCTDCGEAIGQSYYEVNGQITCERCRLEAEERLNAGSSVGRFARATALGLLAAGAGFGVYYAIAKLTGMEFSIIAIVVGVMVGSAVKRGSHGRGGWRYQALAVFLTYTAIVSTYVPFLIDEFKEQTRSVASTAEADTIPGVTATPVAGDTAGSPARRAADSASTQLSAGGILLGVVVLVGFFYAVPFLGGVQNVLGLFIIAIGLYAAWQTAGRTVLKVTGPYRVGAAPASSAAG
jgi:hypothetical protein